MISSRQKDNLTEVQSNIIGALTAVTQEGEWLTAPTITRRTRLAGHGFNATTVYRILSALRSHIEYRTVNGTRRFHLKQSVVQSISTTGGTFIRPGTPWSSSRELRDYLEKESKDFLLLVDPYISEDTLDVLSRVAVPIQIATINTGRHGREQEFIRAYKKFKREKGGQIEIRVCFPQDLHGRYLLTQGRGWVVDHSLQDLGTKPALIVPLSLGTLFSQVHSHFEQVFKKGTLFN